MNRIYLGTTTEFPQNSYYLLENDSFYGIMISNSTNEDYITGLYEEKSEAEKFADMLIRNNVCPVHLCRGRIVPQEIADKEAAAKFIEAVGQFERIMNDSAISPTGFRTTLKYDSF